VRYYLQDIQLKGAWGGPAALQLFQHVIADVAKLPVLEVLSGAHFIADLTLGLGEVVHDYLAETPAK
jgi:acetoacetate decarboxylase